MYVFGRQRALWGQMDEESANMQNAKSTFKKTKSPKGSNEWRHQTCKMSKVRLDGNGPKDQIYVVSKNVQCQRCVLEDEGAIRHEVNKQVQLMRRVRFRIQRAISRSNRWSWQTSTMWKVHFGKQRALGGQTDEGKHVQCQRCTLDDKEPYGSNGWSQQIFTIPKLRFRRK